MSSSTKCPYCEDGWGEYWEECSVDRDCPGHFWPCECFNCNGTGLVEEDEDEQKPTGTDP